MSDLEIQEHDDGLYALLLSELNFHPDLFESRDLVSDGHLLEEMVDSFCTGAKIQTTEIDFDSESDLFCVYSSDVGLLEQIKDIVQKILSDEQIASKILDELDLYDDDESANEEDGGENGKVEDVLALINHQYPDTESVFGFWFQLDFEQTRDIDAAKESLRGIGCAILSDKDLKPIGKALDNSSLAVAMECVPNQDELSSIASKLDGVANEFGGRYSGIILFHEHT